MITKVVSLTFRRKKNKRRLVIIFIKYDHKSGKSDFWAGKERGLVILPSNMITKVVSLTFGRQKKKRGLVIIFIKYDHKSGKSDFWAGEEGKRAGNDCHQI